MDGRTESRTAAMDTSAEERGGWWGYGNRNTQIHTHLQLYHTDDSGILIVSMCIKVANARTNSFLNYILHGKDICVINGLLKNTLYVGLLACRRQYIGVQRTSDPSIAGLHPRRHGS